MTSPKNKGIQVLYDVLSSIIAGLILSLLFFIFSDFIFVTPNLNGKWEVEIKYSDTEKSSFKDMKLYYDVIFIIKGNEISGTGEKDREDVPGNKIKYYSGENRRRVLIEGYLENNYLSKDKLIMHGVEKGEKRESSIIFDLIKFTENEMRGTFSTTIANSSGETKWTKVKE